MSVSISARHLGASFISARTGVSVFAAMTPDAAALGVPMPGNSVAIPFALACWRSADADAAFLPMRTENPTCPLL